MIKRSLLILALIVPASSVLNFLMLTRGHPWWDDFAGYVMQAQAILAWNLDDFITHNTFTIQNSSYPPGPVAYPWGYPLLLAPVVALFGIHPLALKLVGIAFYGVFLVTFYALSRNRLDDRESLILTGVLAFNPTLLLANDLILSDIPFLSVSTLGILLIEFISAQEPGRGQSAGEQGQPSENTVYRELTLGATLFFAAFLRTNGMLLLAPLAVSLLVSHRPDWKTALKRSLIPLLTFVAFFLVSGLLFPNGQDSYLSHFSMFNLPRLWENLLFYLRLPSWTFNEIPAGGIFYPILSIFLLLSVAVRWKRDLPIYIYCLATLGLFILWPERQGLRFIYPILPFLFIFAFDGMRLALSRLPTYWQTPASRVIAGFWALLLILSLGTSAYLAYDNLAAGRAINGPFDEYSYDLYEFIRDETPAESVIIFVRPRAMRLFTGHESFMTENCADLPKGDYVALHEKIGDVGQIPPGQITSCPGLVLEEVFNNRRFTVYRIHP